MRRRPGGPSDVIAIMAPEGHVLQIRFYYGSGIIIFMDTWYYRGVPLAAAPFRVVAGGLSMVLRENRTRHDRRQCRSSQIQRAES
jgi:hypothetical protein